FAATATTTASGTVTFTYYAGPTASGSPLADAPTDAGTYTVVASFISSDGSFASAVSAPVTFVISPAPLTVTVASASKVYGQDDSTSLTGTISGLVSSDPITVSYTSAGAAATAGVLPSGGYAINATLSDNGSGKLADYSVTINLGTLTVTRAPLTV